MEVARDRHQEKRIKDQIVKVEDPGKKAERDDPRVLRPHREFIEHRGSPPGRFIHRIDPTSRRRAALALLLRVWLAILQGTRNQGNRGQTRPPRPRFPHRTHWRSPDAEKNLSMDRAWRYRDRRAGRDS